MPPDDDSTSSADIERFRRYQKLQENREEKEQTLLANLKSRKAELAALLESCSDQWGYEDLIYRFYHQSFKVFLDVQPATEKIVAALRALLPEQPLNEWFLQIVAEGTGRKFALEMNDDWLRHTRPIVEAFFHARYMLEMAVRYAGRKAPPKKRQQRHPPGDVRRLAHLKAHVMPSGWAAFLYLFNLR